MANTAENYQLSIFQRFSLALIYLAVVAIWGLEAGLSDWGSVLSLLAAIGFASLALAWSVAWRQRRLTQYSAWLPILSLFLLIPILVTSASWTSVILLVLMPFLLVLAGWSSYARQKEIKGIPQPKASSMLAFKVALDETMLGYFVSTVRSPGNWRIPQLAEEVKFALKLMEMQGWTAKPENFHQTPESPSDVTIKCLSHRDRDFSVLNFRTHYQPHAELPGAERWLSQDATHTVHARLFEHPGEARPWLMCIHGYRMGWPYLDFQLFPPGWLHYKLGFNLIMPLLPLHGPRKEGMRSGDGFFEGDLLNLLHAQGQAVMDLRACVHWLRSEREVPKLGVYGISLGGLNASLLGCLEADLDSLIAGIPLVDPAKVFELNAHRRLVRGFESNGVGESEIRQLLAPVSPLKMPCQVNPGARTIIAGNQDRILPLEPIQALQKHWGGCPLHWYNGTHLSVRRERVVRDWLLGSWQQHGMLEPQVSERISEQMQAANAGRR